MFEPSGAEIRPAGGAGNVTSIGADIAPDAPDAHGGALADSLALAERQIILRALRAHASRERAAKQLGFSARTLRYKLARLRAAGLDVSNEIQMAGSAA